MTDLSVIIVNYNVKHFLEQCLHAVLKASKEISVEIIVVDNNSADGSAQYIPEKFPGIRFISNTENKGFARANNQAIREASGRYILLLNPDTVVEEDTFTKVMAFMDNHPEAGGLGVKMIDGKGNFLPESKRGLPTPWVAFYKIFGISALFPHSRKFGKYHLTYLDKDQISEVEVLAGAFMWLRKETLDKTGLLDESFFMYGEDIDLSYRITLEGYKNYYFPETTIIHYKGESTKKGSLNYVRVFYNAMIIFARKHFSNGNAGIFSLFIHLAIYFRACISITKRILDRILMPLTDALLIWCGFLVIAPWWEHIRFEPGHFPPELMQFAVPAYILIWITAILFSGGYRKPLQIYRLARGVVWGSITILLIYSLIDETYRFSRALIIIGSFWTLAVLILSRLMFYLLKYKNFRPATGKSKRIAIVGHPREAFRVEQILKNTGINPEIAGYIAVDNSDHGQNYLGQLDQINEIIRINRIDEIIFCAENISSGDIIQTMLELVPLNVDYKIAPPESISIIGSNSIHTAGELYVINMNAITKKTNLRIKRAFDIAVSIFFLVFFPFIIWLFNRKKRFLLNIILVFTGKETWIGYVPVTDPPADLPPLKKGVLHPGDLFPGFNAGDPRSSRLNMLYAKDYSIFTDAEILFKSWNKLDR